MARYARRRNPSSEEEWALEQGTEYGIAVAEKVNFDGNAAIRYVKDNWKIDLEDELKQILSISKKSQVTDSPVSERQLGTKLKEGIETGIRTAIESHEDDLQREAEKHRPPPAPEKPRGEYDAGYARVSSTRVQHQEPAPKKQSPFKPVAAEKPFVKRAAAKTASYIKRSAAWLDEYARAPNPPREFPYWAEQIRRRGLPESEEELVIFLANSGMSKWKIIRALSDTTNEVFAALFPRMPDPDVLMDTLDLIRFAQDKESLKARIKFHRRRKSPYPCEQAVKHLLNIALKASESSDRVAILAPVVSMIHALQACLYNTELDSHAFLWDTLSRALVANR